MNYSKALSKNVIWTLESPDSFEFLTVDPHYPLQVQIFPSREELIHEYRILGRSQNADADKRRQLVDSLIDAVAKNYGEYMRCFLPRHAIRAARGHSVVELLICFECRILRIYEGENDEKGDSSVISASPTDLFNRVAEAMCLPIAYGG